MKEYISYELLADCFEFSHKVIPTNKSLYSKRNQNSDNLFHLITRSKLCEWYVYYIIKSSGRQCTKPDMQIYQDYKKSYDADLVSGSNNIHVKSVSQESVNRYGLSWVMQCNDPVVNNPQENDFFALVVFQDYENVKFIGWLPAKRAIYQNTALNHSSKLAIYHHRNKENYLKA